MNGAIRIIKSIGIIAILLLTHFSILGATANALADGGNPQKKQSLFENLQHDDILDVHLLLDLEEVSKERRSDKDYEGVFSYENKAGEAQQWKVKISLRGRYRRTHCPEMPPLKLDFKKKDLEEAGLLGFDDFKLVTHCVEEEEQARELLLREYLAYRMYNQITEESYRVQLLRITYEDHKTGEKKKHFGFLIEDTAELLARLGAEKWDNPLNIEDQLIDQDKLKQVALFEAMIGNTDWSYELAHNVKVFQKEGKAIFIPYDFDFSGLVKAPYATLKTDIGQTRRAERFYMANPEDVYELDSLFASFSEQKTELIQLIKKQKYLGFSAKGDMIQFLNDFFDQKEVLQIPVNKLAEMKNPGPKF